MAAGDLENIRPTPTAKRTNNITWVDANGNVYPVKEVYWSDSNSVGHLIWQRDHAPAGDEYISKNISTEQNHGVIINWTANTSTITNIKFWAATAGGVSNDVFVDFGDNFVIASDSQSINIHWGDAILGTDIVVLNGSSEEVATYELKNLSISVTNGKTYRLFLGPRYTTHWIPIFYKDRTGTYWTYDNIEDYRLLDEGYDASSKVTAHNDNLPKLEINGVQI